MPFGKIQISCYYDKASPVHPLPTMQLIESRTNLTFDVRMLAMSYFSHDETAYGLWRSPEVLRVVLRLEKGVAI